MGNDYHFFLVSRIVYFFSSCVFEERLRHASANDIAGRVDVGHLLEHARHHG
jgi:hypothetical protein